MIRIVLRAVIRPPMMFPTPGATTQKASGTPNQEIYKLFSCNELGSDRIA
jgi:hypothetical protein